jgi:DNA-binding LytR/AlgR family response regulator
MTNAPAPLRTIIVDDEPLAIERLQILCGDIAEIELIASASDGAQAVKMAEELSPDLLFLDIGMPRMDGIAAARAMAKLNRKPAIIFVTAYDNFAVEAFDLDVADYVLKPVSAQRLHRAVERAAATISTAANVPQYAASADYNYAKEFWVSHRSELIRIAASDIERIEAERDYMRLFTGGRSYLLHQTISALEQKLDPAHFLRIHRSHIIRRDMIKGLRHDGGGVWHALLGDETMMRIGRKYLASVKQITGK